MNTFLLAALVGVALCTSVNAPKVVVEIAIESLCPDCRDAITGSVWDAFRAEGLVDIMDLRLYPYGNAKEKQDPDTGLWQFTCQHGVKECQGNQIETCLINMVQNYSISFPIIWCMERSPSPIDAAPKCAAQFGVPYAPVSACTTSKQGNLWEHEMAVWTESLVPPHTEVPWFVINGQHTDDMNERCMEDLIKVVCEAYTGTKPPGCMGH